MGRLIAAFGTIALLYIVFSGRVPSWVGGGTVFPKVTVTFAPGPAPGVVTVTIRNDGTETITRLSGATDRWDLHRQFPIARVLAAGESVSFDRTDLSDGNDLWLFADKYPAPAPFRPRVKPAN